MCKLNGKIKLCENLAYIKDDIIECTVLPGSLSTPDDWGISRLYLPSFSFIDHMQQVHLYHHKHDKQISGELLHIIINDNTKCHSV